METLEILSSAQRQFRQDILLHLISHCVKRYQNIAEKDWIRRHTMYTITSSWIVICIIGKAAYNTVLQIERTPNTSF